MKKEKTTQFLMKPKVDFCFKELMEDEEVRNAFLAAVLGIDLGEIVESRILPSHLRQKDKDDKLGILDVRVLLNNKEQIDIEIQVTASEYWAERTLFYLGKMFTDQLKPGEDYQKLEKCIHIGILNFTMFILNLGFFMTAGFDQVFNFTNQSVNSVIDILDTYVYRIGLESGQYSLATAVALIKGIVGVFLVLVTHLVSKKVTGKGVW